MQSLFFEQAQQNFDAICQKTCQDHEPYIINRADNNHVVILSLADFNAWQETHYLKKPLEMSEKLNGENNASHSNHQ